MEAGRDWHHVPIDEALAEVGSGPDGLPQDEATLRLSRHGPNRLPEPPRPGALLRFARQFGDLLIQVLIGAALVTAFLGHWVDTAVILAVVVANAVIGFIQEGKAEAALRA